MKNKKRSRRSPGSKQAIFKSIKGAIMGLILSVVCVLIFALIVQQAAISAEAIAAVNQIIKVCAIFLAAFVASRKLTNNKTLAGMAAGSTYVVLAYLAFSLVEGEFGDILVMFADLAMGVAIGALTATIFGKLTGATPVVNKK